MIASDLIQESSSKSGNPPLIAKIDPSALRAHNRKQVQRVVSILNRVFLNSTFAFNPNGGSVGTLRQVAIELSNAKTIREIFLSSIQFPRGARPAVVRSQSTHARAEVVLDDADCHHRRRRRRER